MPPPTAAVASSARRVRNAFRACLFVLVIMAALVALLRWSDDVPPPEPLVTDLPRTPLTTLQGIVGEADTRARPPPLARVDEGTSEAKSAPLVPTTSAATEPLDQASSSAPVATKARVKWYCLMPVGDSLTQGVGAHGSYRAPLLSRLTAAATSVARVGMTGTRRYPCTPRRPGTFFMDAPKDAEDGSLHEGYCNWDSGSIYQQLESRTLYGEASRTPGADCGGDGAPVRYHTALLMMGHNDVFKAAKGCRVPERCEATWVPKNSPHDNGVHSLDTPELLAPYMRCAIAFLRKNFKRNLYNASTALLRRASAPPTAVSRWLGMGGAPALVIGKNPSTGFPCLDVVLYKYIDEVVSDLRADFEQAVKGQDGTWTRRVAVAQFPGFKKGDHTFDSTHPNRQGADLLADGWIAAIESGTFY